MAYPPLATIDRSIDAPDPPGRQPLAVASPGKEATPFGRAAGPEERRPVYRSAWTTSGLAAQAAGLSADALDAAGTILGVLSAGVLGPREQLASNDLSAAAGFRQRLDAIEALAAPPAPEDGPAAAGDLLLAAAALAVAAEPNAAVSAAGLRFAAAQMAATEGLEPTGGRPAEELRLECAATICAAAACRLADKKAGQAAADCLHELAGRRLTAAVAVLWPAIQAAQRAPAPAAAAMRWLADALARWSPLAGCSGEDNPLDPGLLVAACTAALRSPAAATRKAALAALVALDQLVPVLAAVAAEPGCSAVAVATLRSELALHPPARVVFDRPPVVAGQSDGAEAAGLGIGTAGGAEAHGPPDCTPRPPQLKFTEPSLEFESAFECGNLARVHTNCHPFNRRTIVFSRTTLPCKHTCFTMPCSAQASMVDTREYDLWLAPDTNVEGQTATGCAKIHTQWFFFQVRGMKVGEPYRFNILNFEKHKSLYSKGMQPLVYSAAAAGTPGGCGWRRAGSNIKYRPAGPRPVVRQRANSHVLCCRMITGRVLQCA